jgi:hypothetical protein
MGMLSIINWVDDQLIIRIKTQCLGKLIQTNCQG